MWSQARDGQTPFPRLMCKTDEGPRADHDVCVGLVFGFLLIVYTGLPDCAPGHGRDPLGGRLCVLVAVLMWAKHRKMLPGAAVPERPLQPACRHRVADLVCGDLRDPHQTNPTDVGWGFAGTDRDRTCDLLRLHTALAQGGSARRPVGGGGEATRGHRGAVTRGRGPVADPELPLLLGCDVGTSAVKTVLLDSGGTLLARRIAEHPMRHPRPDWAENDPDDWYRGVATTVRGALADAAVDPARVVALSVVAQREPVVLVDGRGAPLTPSISWTDRRTADEARIVIERLGREWLIETTGTTPIPGTSLTHLLWLRRHQPDAWRRARHILAAKDYIVWRLTGAIATDPSTPGRSLMLDLRRGEWSHDICCAFEIDIERLAPIRERPWEVVGTLSAGAAQALGLPTALPIAMGGADDAAAALGAGAIEVGEICVGGGTAANWREGARRARRRSAGPRRRRPARGARTLHFRGRDREHGLVAALAARHARHR